MNDKGFVQFRAKGIIYERNKDGKPIGIKAKRYGSGVVKSGPDMLGKVFRQCTQLLTCDSVTVDEYTI